MPEKVNDTRGSISWTQSENDFVGGLFFLYWNEMETPRKSKTKTGNEFLDPF